MTRLGLFRTNLKELQSNLSKNSIKTHSWYLGLPVELPLALSVAGLRCVSVMYDTNDFFGGCSHVVLVYGTTIGASGGLTGNARLSNSWFSVVIFFVDTTITSSYKLHFGCTWYYFEDLYELCTFVVVTIIRFQL